MKFKTIYEYKIELKRLADIGDPEAAHGYADDILCDILAMLGHQDVVDLFNDIDKWYA